MANETVRTGEPAAIPVAEVPSSADAFAPGMGPNDAVSFWLARGRPEPQPPHRGDATADVVIVGGGFTGLWTALALVETDPTLGVVLLETEEVGFGASGRNGGFCEASLTHGLANGLRHFPDELERLEREGVANLAALVAFTRAAGIDCDLEETGMLTVADHAYQVDEFRAWADEATARGEPTTFLDSAAVQAEVRSPLWQAGLLQPPGRTALLDPAKLARGLRRVALERGVRIHEHTRVTGLGRLARGVRVRTIVTGTGRGPDGRASEAATGSIVAGQVVVATSAYSGWLRRLSSLFVPVYDYVLVSDPLTPEQRASIGWEGRQGMSDANNQFHYFRLTADDRILWGGYDAVYYFGNGIGPRYDRRPATFERLEAQFRAAFPQLAGLAFPYRWGGAIDTTTRFTVTFGRTMGGRVAYALGYTGLGVGASRWAGGIVRDMLLRPESDLLRLRFVRQPPFPFPPEPLRYASVSLVRRELDRADRNDGRRGLVLRTLDALGIGFDS